MGMTFHFIFFIYFHIIDVKITSLFIFLSLFHMFMVFYLCFEILSLAHDWLLALVWKADSPLAAKFWKLKVESWEPRSTLILHKMSMSMIRSLSVIFPWALFILTACVACKLIKSTCRVIILIFDVHFHFSSQHFNLIQMLVKIDKLVKFFFDKDKLVKLFVKKKDI